MRHFLVFSASLMLLSACNTVDGIGKDMGAVGQSFGNMFDNSVQTSRKMRDSGQGGFFGGGFTAPPAPRQAPPMNMGGGYGMAPQARGNMAYGGGPSYGGRGMGSMPPQQYPSMYQQQPRPPAMPQYYGGGGY